jgi:hypothetical protein
MQIPKATRLDRKSGGEQWRDLRFSGPFLEMFFDRGKRENLLQQVSQGTLKLLRNLVPSADEGFITLTHAFRNRVPGKLPDEVRLHTAGYRSNRGLKGLVY